MSIANTARILPLPHIGREVFHQVHKMKTNAALHACLHGPVTKAFVTSPIGEMVIESCPYGLHSMHQTGTYDDDNFKPDINRNVKPISGNDPDSDVYRACLLWLQEYFSNPKGIDNIPKPTLCLTVAKNAPFREKVWVTLASEVGVGQTVSYGELAKLCDNPKAAQAVGSAMSCNPFQLVVPCHRVTRSDSMGLYAHGNKNFVKKWLLEFEGVQGY